MCFDDSGWFSKRTNLVINSAGTFCVIRLLLFWFFVSIVEVFKKAIQY